MENPDQLGCLDLFNAYSAPRRTGRNCDPRWERVGGGGGGGRRERGRQTDRQTETERQTDRDRETDRGTKRQTDTDGERERESDSQTATGGVVEGGGGRGAGRRATAYPTVHCHDQNDYCIMWTVVRAIIMFH